MKLLKNLAIFLAGGVCANVLLAMGLDNCVKQPEEGCVEYEDDEMKVIRTNSKKQSVNMAVIVRKNKKSEES